MAHESKLEVSEPELLKLQMLWFSKRAYMLLLVVLERLLGWRSGEERPRGSPPPISVFLLGSEGVVVLELLAPLLRPRGCTGSVRGGSIIQLSLALSHSLPPIAASYKKTKN